MGDRPSVRLGTGLISVVAAAVSTVLWNKSANKTAILRKLIVHNHQLAAITLQVGYLTLGAVFTPVLPDFRCVAGVDNEWEELALPIAGNTPEGFAADTTLVTGTLGNIIVQASAAGAAPLDVEVSAEIEEVG